jgi:ubiquinone/menaquinone biosynthesis C-methylase UbiE
MNWRKGKLAIARAIRLDLTHHQERYARALRQYVHPGDKWLDVGCGHQIVPVWAMPKEEQERLVASVSFLIGIDVNKGIVRHPLLTYRIKAIVGALPFKDEIFDVVTANMVVEHVDDPRGFLADVFRVLRPGGHFLFVTPNALSPLIVAARMMPDRVEKALVGYLEHRSEEDVFPTVYRMNEPGVIARLAAETGFETEEVSLIGTVGLMDRLGPVAWIECFFLKGLESSFHGKLQPDIIAVLRRKAS